MPQKSQKAWWKEIAVQAESVEDFLNKYYKHDRFRGRGEEYTDVLIKSYQEEFDRRGFTFISQHDSNTGRMVAFCKPEESQIKDQDQ